MFNSRMREMRRYAGNIEDVMHKQRRALSTLGGPAFEFDMRALAARPIREDEQADRWLLDRILIPECVSEIVDPRDEAAYLLSLIHISQGGCEFPQADLRGY